MFYHDQIDIYIYIYIYIYIVKFYCEDIKNKRTLAFDVTKQTSNSFSN